MRVPDLLIEIPKKIKKNIPSLLVGRPGVGKTDFSKQLAKSCGFEDFITTIPVVKDPSEYNGLAYPDKGGEFAKFLPYSDLKRLIDAKKKTLCLIDDMGQATNSVQAALMQLVLARSINEHKISDKVYFMAATNRRKDRSGVNPVLESLKNRFAIFQFDATAEDWRIWAYEHKMPLVLIAFSKYRPGHWETWTPSDEIENTATPRTIAWLGESVEDANTNPRVRHEAYASLVGGTFATEFCAFERIFNQLPDFDDIIKDPKNAPVPTDASTLYAISTVISNRMDKKNIEKYAQYVERFSEKELRVLTFKEAVHLTPAIAETGTFIKWATQHAPDLIPQ